MKCNIARDLLPLYAEGLCADETARELEEHLSGCKDCSALKNGLAVSNTGEVNGSNSPEITPFKKIKRKFKRNLILIISLGVLAAVILFFVGGLTYGELHKGSGWLSFSEIFGRIEVKKAAKLFANGDMDGFLEHIYFGGLSEQWFWSAVGSTDFEDIKSELSARLNETYQSELAGKKCTVNIKDSYIEEYGGEFNVDFDVEGAEAFSVIFFRQADGKFLLYSNDIDPAFAKTANELDFIGSLGESGNSISYMSCNEKYFITKFGNGNDAYERLTEYKAFCDDGSAIDQAFSSSVMFDPESREFYTDCCFKAHDSTGAGAVVFFRARLGESSFFRAELSDAEIISNGMSEQKLNELFELLS